MRNTIANKTKLVPFLENASLLRRAKVKLSKKWPDDRSILKRLLVNHQYRFIYCPINKNASTSMMAALLELGKATAHKNLDSFTAKEIRLYVGLNYSMANYTYREAAELLASDYFKFVIVRNPWARLLSTYANYFVRLPVEKNIISDIAKSAAEYTYGGKNYLEHADSITFEEFAKYVAAKADAELDIHCQPQSYFIEGFDYDFVAKMETLDQDLTLIEEKLQLPFKIKRFNKTAYSKNTSDHQRYATFTSAEIRALKTEMPSYEKFYTPELIALVGERYATDVKRFDYDFLT